MGIRLEHANVTVSDPKASAAVLAGIFRWTAITRRDGGSISSTGTGSSGRWRRTSADAVAWRSCRVGARAGSDGTRAG